MAHLKLTQSPKTDDEREEVGKIIYYYKYTIYHIAHCILFHFISFQVVLLVGGFSLKF